MNIGDVVVSKKGRYDGTYFLVIDVKDGFAYLCDGKSRSFVHPKRKNISHVEQTTFHSDALVQRMAEGANAIDALIRKEIKRLVNL